MFGEGFMLTEGALDLDGFFEELDLLLRQVWGEHWGVLAEEEAQIDPAEDVKLPRIAWEVVRRSPAAQSPKPREYQLLPDPEYPGYHVQIFRQWFEAEVRFTCIHRNRRGARMVAERLQDVLGLWTGYFRQKGITDIFFQEERGVSMEDAPRQPLARRVLVYRIKYERIFHVRTKALEQLTIRAVVSDAAPEDEMKSVLRQVVPLNS